MDTKEKIKVRLSTAILIVIIITLTIVIMSLWIERSRILEAQNQNIPQKETSEQEVATSSPSIEPSYTPSAKSETEENNTTTPGVKNEAIGNLCHFNPEKGVNTDKNTKYSIIKTLNMYGEGITLNIILNSKNQVQVEVTESYDENEPVASEDSIINNMKRKLGKTEIIKGFSNKIDEVEIGTLGQDYMSSVILFLMEDGTVEYISLMDLLQTNNLASRGKLPQLKNIVKLQSIDVSTEEAGWMTMIAIDNEGNFYDISNIMQDANIDPEDIN